MIFNGNKVDTLTDLTQETYGNLSLKVFRLSAC